MIEITEIRAIATCRKLRRIVFIEEQGVSKADDLDDVAIHLLATQDGTPVGSARLCAFRRRQARSAASSC